MHRRSRIAAFAAAALFALVAVSQTVLAAPKDAAAKKLDKDAMETDFLNANFDAAEKKLKDAVKTCGEKDCTPKVKAQVLIHLGIIQVNLTKASDAEASFIEGLKIDKDVAPESDYVSPDVEKVFKEAKKKAAGGGSTAAPKETSTAETPEKPAGELEHEPVTEQMVETPVPLFVGIPEGMKVAKLIVMYRAFGAEEWKKLELKKMGGGYGGEIPCEETGTTGDLKYYIKAVDSGGDPVAEVGSKSKPLITKIKNQLEGEAPHLPDKPPPAKCQGKGTCPPDFPGCKETPQCGNGGWGASCGRDKDCQCGYHCKKEEGKDEGTCEEGAPPDDTGGGAAAGKLKKNWVSLVLSQDIAMMSGSGVCSLDTQNKGEYICYREDGDQYHGVPASGDGIQGGFALATFRVMAGYERLFGKNITVGAKLGWAFLGSPSGFLPFHGELRGSYYFGANPFSRAGLRPFIFVNVGVAAVDSKVNLKVIDAADCGGMGTPTTGSAGTPNEGNPVCRYDLGDGVQQENPTRGQQTVTAWHRTGRQFAGVGGGIQYAIKQGHAIGVSLKFMAMFPVFAPVLSPEIGYSIGF